MIEKIELEKMMDALMLRYWGIFSINSTYRETIKAKNYFAVPNSVLETEVGTVIAIAVPYALEGTTKPQHKNMAKVEAFGWDFDYHVQLKALLNQIKVGIEALCNQHFPNVTVCVDNSPYNDREVGFYAGFGQVGYNHLLIHEHLGSNFFIGYLVIHHPISLDPSILVKPESLPDKLVHPFCEQCRRCTQVCPSHVCGIEAVNMAECLSAQTQSKEMIRESMRIAIQDRLYGCSVCQTVCPLNQNKTAHARLTLKSENWLDALALLDMTNQDFKRLYGHMGFSWRPSWIYKRNALIILGNIGDDAAYQALIGMKRFLVDEKLSGYYSWAINRLKSRTNEHLDTFGPKMD